MSDTSVMVTKATNAEKQIVSSITEQLDRHNITLTSYQRECAINAISAVNALLAEKGLNWNSAELDPSNLQDVIRKVALQKLNALSSNREVYFQIRSVKIGNEWKKTIEVGVEGDGYDAILRNFGVDVKKVYPFWAVREDDEFEYPSYSGIELTPPKWKQGGTGKVIRIVYPIQKTDGTIEYLIAERADVVRNLQAHIVNNMMNETFGICADRYKATAPQKAEIDEIKRQYTEKMRGMTLEELISSQEFQKWISPAWSSPQSSEAMIIRKMRNNITRKYPKNFENSYQLQAFNEMTDEETADVSSRIEANANTGELIDIDLDNLPNGTEDIYADN